MNNKSTEREQRVDPINIDREGRYLGIEKAVTEAQKIRVEENGKGRWKLERRANVKK